MKLTKEELKKLEDGLLAIRTEIEKQLASMKEGLDFGDNAETLNIEEETDQAEEFSNYLSLKETLKTRLENVNAALQRMKDGTYGICSVCGDVIDLKVLQVMPESQLCQACKKKQ